MVPQSAAHLREQPAQEILKIRWSVQLFDKTRALPLKFQATLIIGDIRRFENFQQFRHAEEVGNNSIIALLTILLGSVDLQPLPVGHSCSGWLHRQ